jgi:hypothetical protein
VGWCAESGAKTPARVHNTLQQNNKMQQQGQYRGGVKGCVGYSCSCITERLT